MASAKIIWKDKPYKDGTIPISLQIINNRQAYSRLICRVEDKNWDRKRMEVKYRQDGHIQLNEKIQSELKDARAYIFHCSISGEAVDPIRFFNRLKGDTLVQVIRSRADEFDKVGSFGTGNKYRAVANKIERSGLDVSLQQISKDWIDRYDQEMQKLGNGPATRRKDMTVISPTLNSIPGAFNPFEGYKKPSKRGTKEKLNREEFERYRSVELHGFEDLCRKAWIFAAYARGIRIFDLLTLRWTNIINGRLVYVMDKGKTKKMQSILITEQMQVILDSLDKSTEYIFPVLSTPYRLYSDGSLIDRKRFKERANRKANHFNKAVITGVHKAGIPKHITSHCARHSFSYIAARSGLDIISIQNMLGHGRPSTTEGYIEDLMRNDEMDEAVKGVFG